LFRNPIYLDPTQFPELSACRTAQQLLASGAFRVELEALRSASRIDHERVAGLLESLFEALHGCFIGMHRDRPTARGRAYARFREREGEQLDRFATFSALEEELARRGYRRDWRAWPAAYRNPDSGALREFRKLHAERVDYHAFLQFELEQQLARAARAGKTAGLELGLYQDLPLGSVASGFDSWAFPELVASGAQLGAPPDRYSASGQDWGLPPLLPRGLAANGYRFWSRVLRTSLSHAGALRLDHAMGLLRQFWIPTGASAEVGAYVRFPFPELAAVLALESHRAHALIVGEDLGSVPRGFQALLARHGILSSRVLFFERRGGGFKPARSYSPRALVTVGTHDTPTLAGFWAERDIEIRRQLGLLDEASLGRAREIRAEERAALLRRLRADGSLRAAAPEPSGAELCAAVHRFVCATPAPLVGLSLDDLAGETEPVNVPGVSSEHYPSWTRRMQTPVNDLSRTPRVRSGLGGARTRAGRRR
jgi:4-alpha-glucanotransferase